MAKTTLTLTASGRLPGALSSAPSASTVVVVASQVVAQLPFVNSAFTCLYLDCLGTGLNRGQLAVAKGTGARSGVITIAGSQQAMIPSVSIADVERNSSTSTVYKGGGIGT